MMLRRFPEDKPSVTQSPRDNTTRADTARCSARRPGPASDRKCLCANQSVSRVRQRMRRDNLTYALVGAGRTRASRRGATGAERPRRALQGHQTPLGAVLAGAAAGRRAAGRRESGHVAVGPRRTRQPLPGRAVAAPRARGLAHRERAIVESVEARRDRPRPLRAGRTEDVAASRARRVPRRPRAGGAVVSGLARAVAATLDRRREPARLAQLTSEVIGRPRNHLAA